MTCQLEDMNFIFSWWKTIIFYHLKIKFISLRCLVISSMYLQDFITWCCVHLLPFAYYKVDSTVESQRDLTWKQHQTAYQNLAIIIIVNSSFKCLSIGRPLWVGEFESITSPARPQNILTFMHVHVLKLLSTFTVVYIQHDVLYSIIVYSMTAICRHAMSFKVKLL